MRGRKSAKASARRHHHYSVRLAGMALWDEHLASRKLARRSAREPQAMGLVDVHIIDEETGQCLE
jgi:hypothetical protein